MAITKSEARKRAEHNWAMWLLLLSAMNITYSELNQMDMDDLAETNAALDMYIEMMEKSRGLRSVPNGRFILKGRVVKITIMSTSLMGAMKNWNMDADFE